MATDAELKARMIPASAGPTNTVIWPTTASAPFAAASADSGTTCGVAAASAGR